MPQTRTLCPRCHQPIVADINQLFDVNTDPEAKQRILSGAYNIVHCPNCGYEGNVATPLVYHDPDKELLLTYFPPDLGLPVNEQERLVGPLINQVVNNLPTEKRKGYLLRPQNMLTMQTMVERILEADGITHEMIEAQQKRLNLLQRLLGADDAARQEIVKEEDQLIDETFFALLNRMIEAAMGTGDEQSGQQLAELEKKLLPMTTVGKRLQSELEETQAAVKSLQDASKKGLTRESLLDLLTAAPTETRLSALVGMARGGMDYTFFQLLTERIEKAKDEEKKKLEDLREKLVKLTQDIDRETQAQVKMAHDMLEKIIASDNIQEAIMRNLPGITDLFLDVLKAEMQAAKMHEDKPRMEKLQQVFSVLQRASAPPPEYALIEDLISAQDDADRHKILEEHKAEITPEFLQLFNSLITQAEAQNQEKQLLDQLQAAYRSALRFSMEKNIQQ